MTSERVEKIAAVLERHAIKAMTARLAKCECGETFLSESSDERWAWFAHHQAEQVAALDGARTVEWGIGYQGYPESVTAADNEESARRYAGADFGPLRTAAFRREVGEWEVAE